MHQVDPNLLSQQQKIVPERKIRYNRTIFHKNMKHRHFRTALLAASLASAFVALAIVSAGKMFTASHAQVSGGGTYLIDDTDPRFSKGGYWFPFFLNYAYNGQIKIGRKTMNPRARWQYSELRAGTYEVWVTWVPHGTFASNAPFTVRVSEQVEPRTVLIDQRRMPEQQMGNTRWQSLGVHSVSEGTLEVILTDQGIDNWFIVADAVQIVPVQEPPRSSSSASSSSLSSSQHYEYFCNGTWQSTPCSSSSSSRPNSSMSSSLMSSVGSSASSVGSLTSAGWQRCDGNDICGAFIVNNQCINSGHVDCNAPGGGMTGGTPTGQSCGVPGCTGQCFRCPTGSSASSSYSSAGSSTASVTDLSVGTPTVEPATLQPGQSTTIRWPVRNNGNIPAAGAELTVNIPQGIQLIGGDARCQGNSQQAICTIGQMSAGQAVTMTLGFSLQQGPSCSSSVTFDASVSGSQEDSDSTNNTVENTVEVDCGQAQGADVRVAIPQMAPAQVQAGGIGILSWRVENNGAGEATNVALVTNLPPGMSFVPSQSDSRCSSSGGQQVTCQLGSIAPHQSTTVGIASAFSSTFNALIPLRGAVEATENDPIPANNSVQVIFMQLYGIGGGGGGGGGGSSGGGGGMGPSNMR